MEPISFCINTSKNEKEYIKLLMYSMHRNLSHLNHEIIVFVDSDNQGTLQFLLTQKEFFPNLRILMNPLPIPMGYQLNINLMFERSTNEIVSLLQSDMIISPNYDVNILKHLDEKTILTSTRIEPPLHPPGPEKIVMDFGTTPDDFVNKHFDDFCKFAEKSREPDKITHYYFAPFTCYKKAWLDIGGHDTIFRRSREDSDVLWRLILNGNNIKQTWNAMVYHFTCTSSRGVDWWKGSPEADDRLKLQQQADRIELRKFTRKWGSFAHPTTLEEANGHKYNIAANIRGCNEEAIPVLLDMFCLFDKIYIYNSEVLSQMEKLYPLIHTPANHLLNVSPEDWEAHKSIFRRWEFRDIYLDGCFADTNENDIVVSFGMGALSINQSMFDSLVKMNDIVHESLSEGDSGEFQVSGLDVKVNRVVNRIKDNIYVKNPGLGDVKLVEL